MIRPSGETTCGCSRSPFFAECSRLGARSSFLLLIVILLLLLFLLPPYCPSLNLIERLWGHIKRTVLANVLYASLNDLVAAFRKGARRLTGDREHMGFMFDHDDVVQKSPRAPCKIAA